MNLKAALVWNLYGVITCSCS